MRQHLNIREHFRRGNALTDFHVVFHVAGTRFPIILAATVPPAGSALHQAVFASAANPLAGFERLRTFVRDAREQALRNRRLEDLYVRNGAYDEDD